MAAAPRPSGSRRAGLKIAREILCAGDRAPPCFLAERDGSRLRLTAWDPATGARGREVASLPYESQLLESMALAPDGDRLAHSLCDGRIEVRSLAAGSTTTLACPECGCAQFLTWEPTGDLLATGMYPYRLVRLHPDGTNVILHQSRTVWLKEPRVAPDGRIALLSRDLGECQFSWVPLPEGR